MLEQPTKCAYLYLLLLWLWKQLKHFSTVIMLFFVLFSFRNPGSKEEDLLRAGKEDQQHQGGDWQHQADTGQTSHWTRGWRSGPPFYSLGSGDSSAFRASGSRLKGPRFESWQEWQETFLLQGQPSVLTLILVSIPPLCYRSST